MRFISKRSEGFVIYAVTGVNSISFAVDYMQAETQGLLGFAIERHDLASDERYFVKGFKVFEEFLNQPDENTVVYNGRPILLT